MSSNLSKTIIAQSKHIESEKNYWTTKLSGTLVRTYFPYDNITPGVSASQKHDCQIKIPADLFSKAIQLSRGSDNNLYILLLTCLTVLINKYTENKDIIIAVPIYKQEIDGEFINTALPIRIQLTGQETVKELLIQCKNTVFEANENLNFPIERLIDTQLELQFPGDGGSLFEIGILLQNIQYQKYIEHLNLNILFSFLKTDEYIEGFIEYNPHLYMKSTIERTGGHFIYLLQIILNNINLKVAEIELLSSEERHRLLNHFNETKTEVPRYKTIIELFEAQAEKRGEHFALQEAAQISLKYRELNEKSNQLARILKQKGVKADTIVAVMTLPSVQTVIGILAVLKAGGTYLPIDPEFPVERINYMLMDSRIQLLLTQTQAVEKTITASEFININDNTLYEGNSANFPGMNTPGDIIYMIYTSGTSGKPKGVLIKNENLVNYVGWFIEKVGLTEKDKAMLLSSFAFDLGYTSIYSSILAGGELHLIAKEIFLIPERLLDHINKNGITYLKLTPSLFSVIINNPDFTKEKCASLRLVVLGGEPIKPQDLSLANQVCQNLQIMNHYGPTETTIGSIARFIDFNRFEEYKQNPTLGTPITNTEIYILNESLKPVPIGIPAELCIGGNGVGRGYLNQPELTASKFIANPFRNEGRIYRTGDRARWNQDGDVEFLGRIDTQIKIRGFRIELEEVEKQLLKQESITNATVIARQDDNRGMYLCAYYISSNPVEIPQLREYLAAKLPFYMIPAVFVKLEKIPVTANGKVDRKALPEPGIITDSHYIPPTDKQQEKLAAIWSSVLGIEKDKISIDANFFELGGDSLKATTLIAKIHKACNFQISLIELFKYPTLKGISEIINQSVEDKFAAIEPAEEKEFYPASSTQKRIYILQQIETQSTFYNVPGILSIEGEVELTRINEIYKKLISRHAALRTSFVMLAEELMQRIHNKVEFDVHYFEALRGKQEREDIVNHFVQPFDLSCAPLLRVGLIKTGEKKYLFYIDMHHIIRDATTIQILNNEFMALYRGEELPPLRLHYKDYSEWQNSRRMQEILNTQRKYWQQEFFNEIPVLNLPTDYPRPANQSFEGASVYFELSEAETMLLNEIARAERITLFMLLSALFYVFLYKISSQEDIVVGTPIASRTHEDLARIIGMLVNTLAIRNVIPRQGTFKEFLNDVKNKTLNAYDNQDYPFEDLVENVLVKRDLSRNPIFDVMFVLNNVNEDPDNVPHRSVKNLDIANYPSENKTSKFDLTLFSVERRGKLCFSIEYCTKLFREETVLRFIQYFKKIVSSVVEYPGKIIADIEVIPDEERKKIVNDFNATEGEYPVEKTIHRLFAEQTEQTPDNIAVVAPAKGTNVESHQHVTYKELNRNANRLAHKLRTQGVGLNTIVGIIPERSIEMIIGIIGILKACGAYLPIDEVYPPERKKYMLEDSGVKLVMVSKELENPGDYVPGYIKIMDIRAEDDDVRDSANFDDISGGEALVYMLYTSGSTGKPKGVMLEHRNLVNLFHYQFNYTNLNCSNILQFSALGFDVHFQEIFSALLSGGRVYLVRQEIRTDIPKLFKLIEIYGICTVFWPISFIKVIFSVEEYAKHVPSCIEHIQTAGEQVVISDNFRKYLKKNKVYLHNHYGPAETHVVTALTIHPDDDIPELPSIGKPILNTHIYIVDKKNSLLPLGVAGELWIGGVQVGRGYYGKENLTREKFIQNPFRPDERVYRSGDLARWHTNGNIEFLGRIDHQVKIRGYRVETGEIESRLSYHPGIKETVVMARQEDNGDKYLCAYIVADKELSLSSLRDSLSKELPDFMIPSYFIMLEKMPLTPNGKIDRRALPKPELKAIESYIAPRDEIEKELVILWSEILGKDELHSSQLKTSIGIDDNFFELGGHSLKATILVSKIHKAFDVKIPLIEIFKMPRIKQLAKYIKETGKKIYISITPTEEKTYYPLSSAQMRLYILQQMNANSTAYNLPEIIALPAISDSGKIEETFVKLINRHESLRTSFHMVNDKPVQVVQKKVTFDLDLADLEDARAFQDYINRFIRPFALANAPLIRAGLIKKSPDSRILIVDMHHIISDGISREILVNDFLSLYDGEVLPPLRVQYKDFSHWQIGEKENLKNQGEYWLREYEGVIPVLELPTDYPRPVEQSFEGNNLNFEITGKETLGLKAMALAEGSTQFMVLMAIYNILLAKLSGQEEIITGTPIAGRRHADLEKIIGMFVNTLALRNYPSGERTFREFLCDLKERTLMAFENQDFQFEELVDKLSVKRDIGRNPLFDVMFILQNMDTASASRDEHNEIENSRNFREGYPDEYENIFQTAKFDLSLTAWEIKDRGIFFSIRYCTKLFKKETIERFIIYFKKIFSTVVNEPAKKLREIEILSDVEKNLLLYEFNDTQTGYPKDKTIHRLFEEQANSTPDNIAIIGPTLSAREKHLENFTNTDASRPYHISYGKLNEKADQLAYLPLAKGTVTDTIVGIMAERSVEMIIGILAILKSGCAYLPIPPDYPEERKQYMLKDSGANMCLTRGEITNLSSLQALNTSPNSIPSHEHQSHVPATSLAYIIYTSGTTGRPKGVSVQHQSVVNMIWNHRKVFGENPGSRISQVASAAFDAMAFEIWPCLSGGAVLHLADDETCRTPQRMKTWLIKNQITISFQSTLIAQQLLAEQWPKTMISLQAIRTAGDRLTCYPTIPYPFRFFNLYGPTEDTVWTTWTEVPVIPAEQNTFRFPPIGKPVGNKQVYILNHYMKMQPMGVSGELCISGDGLARGYLNRPELTAEKFDRALWNYRDYRDYPDKTFLEVSEPFFKKVLTRRRQKIYRTGDLARWLSDGNIEFLGRIDHQVKIRGFRIELGEIENCLLRIDGIKETVVVAREEDGGDKHICAYFVSDNEYELSGIREFLSKELPDYMMPAYFIKIDKMPLTPNGKIDRNALPGAEAAVAPDGYLPPCDETEEKLTVIWADVLGIEIEKIGVQHNFFELGGNSLSLVTMVSRVNKEFGHEIPITQIYHKPSIREISKMMWVKNFEENPVVLLNKVNPKKIFCFPPQIGYGIFYLPLANILNDYSFYAFTFIEDLEPKARLKTYADIITDIQPRGPYILFGYSMASNLTFQVAKTLENRGCEVSDIIFFDSFFFKRTPRELAREDLDELYRYIDGLLAALQMSSLKEKVIEKTLKFMEYHERISSLEKINANVHLILSSEAQNNEYPDHNCWKDLTFKDNMIYNGSGGHQEMFLSGALEKNAAIMRRILDNIESRA